MPISEGCLLDSRLLLETGHLKDHLWYPRVTPNIFLSVTTWVERDSKVSCLRKNKMTRYRDNQRQT